MKTFKVIDGKVMVDGVVYSSSPSTDCKIIGKSGGIIHSINITGKGQFFPLSGQFNDGTTPIITTETSEPAVKKSKLAKTELKESSSAAVDQSGKLVKVKRTKKTK
jgi:hypothetical protein